MTFIADMSNINEQIAKMIKDQKRLEQRLFLIQENEKLVSELRKLDRRINGYYKNGVFQVDGASWNEASWNEDTKTWGVEQKQVTGE